MEPTDDKAVYDKAFGELMIREGGPKVLRTGRYLSFMGLPQMVHKDWIMWDAVSKAELDDDGQIMDEKTGLMLVKSAKKLIKEEYWLKAGCDKLVGIVTTLDMLEVVRDM